MKNEILALNDPLSGNKGVSWQQVQASAEEAAWVKAYKLTASGIEIDWTDGTRSTHRDAQEAILAIHDNGL